MNVVQVSTGQYLDLKKVDIPFDTITEFGLLKLPLYYKHGGFKRFATKGYVMSGGVRYLCGDFHIPDLRTHFKGRTSISKETVSSVKYDSKGRYQGDRKAINWTYKIVNL